MALVPALTLPYTFVNGTIIDAGQVNADFAALMNSLNTNSRTLLTAPTTFYVAPGGADVPGNGLAITSPAATVQFVLGLLQNSYDLNMQSATIQLANGTYNQTLQAGGALVGQQSATSVIIQGNMASPNLVTWNGDPCINAFNGALLTVQGMTLQSAISQAIISTGSSRVHFLSVIFGPVVGAHLLSARGGLIEAWGNYTIAGGGGEHVFAVEGGHCFIDGRPGNFTNYLSAVGVPVVTITGTPAFSNAFIIANSGEVRVTAAITGSTTGNQAHARWNGVINILGQGATYLPGTAGTYLMDTGGQIG
jgi:hypothetical protein